jgi:enoyl-CoA hydratase
MAWIRGMSWGDVVGLAAGQRHRQRDALRASAITWCSAASCASSASCSCCQTPLRRSPAAAAIRSSRSRIPARAARTSTGCLYTARTGPAQDLAVIQPPAVGMISPPRDGWQRRIGLHQAETFKLSTNPQAGVQALRRRRILGCDPSARVVGVIIGEMPRIQARDQTADVPPDLVRSAPAHEFGWRQAMTWTTLRVQADESTAEIVFTRPDLLNRFDALAHREFIGAVRSLERRPDLRAVVLAGEGKAFSAGGDFDLMQQANADMATRQEIMADTERLLAVLLDARPPIVVALHGDAIGLGATIALCCDLVVSHPRCRIGDPHVQIGLVAGDGGCVVWPQVAGMARAKRHLLTGDSLSGEEAYRIGIVSDLVDTPDEVLPAARSLAHRLASLPPLAVQGTKRTLNAALRQRFAEVMPIALNQELVTLGSDDFREAIDAFKKRRSPVYRSR